MSRIAVVAPPLPSHYRALEALGAELLQRGHSVTFLHQADAGRWISQPGIGFQPLEGVDQPGPLSAQLQRAARPGGPLGLKRVIEDLAATTDRLCRTLPAQLQRLSIDLVIADQMEAAGGLVAEALGIPFVSVACALPVNREPGLPLPVMAWAYRTDARAQRLYQESARVYDWCMRPHRAVIERHAKAFGLGRREALHDCLSPLAQISQTVTGFDFPRHRMPAHFHAVGPLRSSPSSQGEPLAWPISADRPFVFASLGTLQGQRFRLFRRIARACAQCDAQLLVAHCGGLNTRQADRLVADGATWVTDFARQQQVLERADAVITHAGLNTVMDALVAGTPALALPIAFDQPGCASRLVHAGAGLRASPRLSSSAWLGNLLRRLLEEPPFAARSRQLGAEVMAAGGSRRAADIIESVLGVTVSPVESVAL